MSVKLTVCKYSKILGLWLIFIPLFHTGSGLSFTEITFIEVIAALLLGGVFSMLHNTH